MRDTHQLNPASRVKYNPFLPCPYWTVSTLPQGLGMIVRERQCKHTGLG
jgi:hypothetical protein